MFVALVVVMWLSIALVVAKRVHWVELVLARKLLLALVLFDAGMLTNIGFRCRCFSSSFSGVDFPHQIQTYQNHALPVLFLASLTRELFEASEGCPCHYLAAALGVSASVEPLVIAANYSPRRRRASSPGRFRYFEIHLEMKKESKLSKLLSFVQINHLEKQRRDAI